MPSAREFDFNSTQCPARGNEMTKGKSGLKRLSADDLKKVAGGSGGGGPGTGNPCVGLLEPACNVHPACVGPTGPNWCVWASLRGCYCNG
jgi:hypothetical protein